MWLTEPAPPQLGHLFTMRRLIREWIYYLLQEFKEIEENTGSIKYLYDSFGAVDHLTLPRDSKNKPLEFCS